MKIIKTSLKLLGATIIYLIAGMISQMIFPISEGFTAVSSEESWFLLPSLLITGLVYSTILYIITLKTNGSRKMLIVHLTLIFFLINTLLTQMETLYFRSAFPIITNKDMLFLFLGGFVITIIYVPLSILLLKTGETDRNKAPDYVLEKCWWKYVIASLIYIPFYLGAGMIAQLSPALQAEYQEWIVQPELFLWLPVFQIFRGALFAGTAVLLIRLIPSRKALFLTVPLTFAFFISTGLITPTALMNAQLRMVHFWEITLSMIAYGLVTVWLLTKKTGDVQ